MNNNNFEKEEMVVSGFNNCLKKKLHALFYVVL